MQLEELVFEWQQDESADYGGSRGKHRPEEIFYSSPVHLISAVSTAISDPRFDSASIHDLPFAQDELAKLTALAFPSAIEKGSHVCSCYFRHNILSMLPRSGGRKWYEYQRTSCWWRQWNTTPDQAAS